MNVGIIGYGYWGPNITRNFNLLEGCTLFMLADKRQERLEIAKKHFPSLKITTSSDELIESPDVDAVVIVSPVHTHYPLAKKALENGKHVLIEKPMTTSIAHSEELIQIANEKNLVLMVDHTFLYTGAVEKIKELIDDGKIGKIHYVDSTRINLGLFQQDVNVLWDLATHDISIINYLIAERPISVQAVGVSHTGNNIENIAYLTLQYESGLIVHFNCSWSSPVKLRNMLIGGDKRMIVYNDIEPTDKIKVYDRGYSIISDDKKEDVLIDYRLGDIYIPKISIREALAGMVKDFCDAVTTGSTPRSGAEFGLEVVKVLELAEKSLKENGAIQWIGEKV